MQKTVKDIMKENPHSIGGNCTIKEVLHLIQVEGYSHIPIIEESILKGVISKSDLVENLAAFLMNTSGKVYTKLLLEHFPISNLMTKDPICLRETDSVDYAAELLLQGEFHGLFVLNHSGQLVGVVTSYDLLKSVYSDFAKEQYT